MKSVSRHIAMAAVAAAALFGSTDVLAQGQGGGNFDPEQFRQRMAERYQEVLGVSGAEWTAIEPLFTAVQEKQRAAGGGRGGFGAFGGRGGRGGGGAAGGGGAGGGRGGRGGGGFGGEPSPEAEALQAAIDSGDAAQIKTKLAAYRDSRKKAAAELQMAREKLRKVLTAKQEAMLVMMGTLD